MLPPTDVLESNIGALQCLRRVFSLASHPLHVTLSSPVLVLGICWQDWLSTPKSERAGGPGLGQRSPVVSQGVVTSLVRSLGCVWRVRSPMFLFFIFVLLCKRVSSSLCTGSAV